MTNTETTSVAVSHFVIFCNTANDIIELFQHTKVVHPPYSAVVAKLCTVALCEAVSLAVPFCSVAVLFIVVYVVM